MIKRFFFFLMIISAVEVFAQDKAFEKLTIPDVQLRDTVFMGYTLEPVDVYAIPIPKNLGLSSRDKMYLRKVYPYALRIAHLVEQLDRESATIDKKRKRKQYINEMEKMLKKQFTDDVKDLTRIQGQMLTKLVYRETNQTIFDLIKKYKSGMSAGWWNFVGKFYNQSLKMEYDPKGEDAEMEKYVDYLDKIYQRDGVKKEIQKETFDLPVQDKKRKRKGK